MLAGESAGWNGACPLWVEPVSLAFGTGCEQYNIHLSITTRRLSSLSRITVRMSASAIGVSCR